VTYEPHRSNGHPPASPELALWRTEATKAALKKTIAVEATRHGIELTRGPDGKVWGRCPICNGRLWVNTRHGCWGCEGACDDEGDVIAFVCRYDSVDEDDARERLSGIQRPALAELRQVDPVAGSNGARPVETPAAAPDDAAGIPLGGLYGAESADEFIGALKYMLVDQRLSRTRELVAAVKGLAAELGFLTPEIDHLLGEPAEPRAAPSRQPILEAALGYAARGWHVFPVHPETKRPLLKGDEGKGGFYLASTDPQQIVDWWKKWPKAMIGVRTGSILGAFAVDLDACQHEKTGEIFTAEGLLQSLEKEIECSLPATWTDETPRGGRHYYFKIPAGVEIRNRNPLAPLRHVDVKGEKGSVTVAPSVRPDGNEYRWITSPDDIELADPPPALVDLILKRGRWTPQDPPSSESPKDKPRSEVNKNNPVRRAAVQRYVDVALDNQVANVVGAGKGNRNQALNNAALSLGKIVAGAPDFLSEGKVRDVLFNAAKDIGLVKDDGAHGVKATITSGLREGAKDPIDISKIGTKVGKPDGGGNERPPGDQSDADGGATRSAEQEPGRQGQEKKAGWRANAVTLETLQNKTFDPVSYLVPGLIPEGLALFAGRPKTSKSWLTYDLAIATAGDRFTLGEYKPLQGDVLYLALEDNERRLRERAEKLLTGFGGTWPERMTIVTSWRRINAGCVEDLNEWCNSVECPRLIVVDTFTAIRPLIESRNQYTADYYAVEGLQKFAGSRAGLSIIGVLHTRKMESDDPFDTLNATLGLNGAADTLMVLVRKAGQATLHVNGRDVGREEKALLFSPETCRWTILGGAAEIHRSSEQSRVLAVLGQHPDGLGISEIASVAGLASNPAATKLLFKMADNGEVERIKRGLYGMPGTRARLVAEAKARVSARDTRIKGSKGISSPETDTKQSHSQPQQSFHEIPRNELELTGTDPKPLNGQGAQERNPQYSLNPESLAAVGEKPAPDIPRSSLTDEQRAAVDRAFARAEGRTDGFADDL
jgi:Bifunctional DNA primase/polymerase, N-terminal/AAA domain